MGLAVLGDFLYIVYHKTSAVHIYSKIAPYNQHSAPDKAVMKWPRGMATSQRHRSIYVTDWSSMFAGRLWCMSDEAKQVALLNFLQFINQ